MSSQLNAVRLAECLEDLTYTTKAQATEAALLLRSQGAEIERLRAEIEALRKQEPVAEVTAIDEYGPCFGWRAHWIDAVKVGSKIYTRPQPAPIQEPVAWMNVRNGFICKKPTNADYQQPLYLAAGAQPAQSEWEVKIGEKLLPKARPAPSVPDVDSIVDLMSEFATHDIERGQMEFDKWTLREAVEAALAAAPEAPKRKPLTDKQLREVLEGTNYMVRNAMHGPFWPELEQACRAVETAHGIGDEA